jgi:hypothetical protein
VIALASVGVLTAGIANLSNTVGQVLVRHTLLVSFPSSNDNCNGLVHGYGFLQTNNSVAKAFGKMKAYELIRLFLCFHLAFYPLIECEITHPH